MPSSIDADLLLQRFYRHVEARGGDIYLTQPTPDGRVIDYSFAQVYDQAARMAAHLDSLGFERQSKIAIVSKNCAHFIMAELAIWMAGHVTVALYPTLSHSTANYILEHSDAKLLFVGKLDTWTELEQGVPEGMPCITLPLAPATKHRGWDDIIAATEPVADKRTRAADDESLIIYTSGSTGTPKGVMHSFRTISVPTKGLVSQLGINEHERQISYLPLAHAMDRWLSGCVSLYAGSRVFFADSLETFVADLKRARPTVFLSVPRLWLKFQLGVYAKLPKRKLDRLLAIPIIRGIIKKKILANLGLEHVRFAGSGSAPIPAELIQWYRDLGLELLEGYGMSENFNYSHLTRPGHGRPGYIGNAYPDVDCKLSDAGEILVRSPGNMLGYYKEQDLSKAAFTEDGYLQTGDLGVIDEQQRLRITGRLKELFKTSKGKYVAPAPIENILNNDPNVELSLVAGSGMPLTHAVLQLSEDLLPTLDQPGVKQRITADLERLLASTNARVEEYERLGFLVVAKQRWTIEDEQLTPTMKIKRATIEAMYEAKRDHWYSLGVKVIWET
ncbi:Long-chain-fatty-acid--CoA ligase [Enhygromyxa salina]|uniref:Long-chain-fatty-acid--CoA ligase n=1 Tax=Enhygromyxa salina TaxID=215803 RepID=A0A0C1ZIJ6_9BACT|nr:AMP-binding protein [Enhygromyxa salina]KIG17359.1 Long-chain-fatty-acid--CoA ligase [Enhygromyxa salina]